MQNVIELPVVKYGVKAREGRILNRFDLKNYTVSDFTDDLLYCDLNKLKLTYAPLIDIIEEFDKFKNA